MEDEALGSKAQRNEIASCEISSSRVRCPRQQNEISSSHYFIYDIRIRKLGYFVHKKYDSLFEDLNSHEKIKYTGKENGKDAELVSLFFTVTAKGEKEAEESLLNLMDQIHVKHCKICNYV
jgi:hypothetical protein